ncbi:hypothetical protein ACU3L3_07335 [Priestia endophytica]
MDKPSLTNRPIKPSVKRKENNTPKKTTQTDYLYAAQFEDGRYFQMNMLEGCSTESLRHADLKPFKWAFEKDFFFKTLVEGEKLKYKIIEIKLSYEVVG